MTQSGDEQDKEIAKRVEGAPTHEDPWRALTALTPARLGLGRVGAALRTSTHLGFLADHAFARDAVHAPFSAEAFAASLASAVAHPTLVVTSRARDRTTYLRRPDLGRRLSDAGRERLLARARGEVGGEGLGSDTRGASDQDVADVALVVCDGLSSTGIERHGPPLVSALLEGLSSAGLLVAPIAVAIHGRVALGDEVGEALGARLVIVVIGERPGLSAADSVGLYLTFAPRAGRTDAERNCISNVHPPDGLGYQAAAHKAVWLTRAALSRGETGVHLKDESEGLSLVLRPEPSAEEPEPQ